MKKILFTVLFLSLICSVALAKKTTYIYTDNRFDFVKIDEMSKKEAENVAASHPFTISEEQIRAVLREIKLARTFIMKKETETQDIFDERAINFLAPKLIEALSKATYKDKIIFSYLTKDPKFALRNDRLTIVDLWASDNKLHFVFEKLLAKLVGDYDKRGDFSKIIARARGLRVSLEVREGQAYGTSTDEVVVDLNYDFSKPVIAAEEATPAASEQAVKSPIVQAKKGDVAPEAPKTTKDRLKELDGLKADGLITEKEYKEKRKEIIKGL